MKKIWLMTSMAFLFSGLSLGSPARAIARGDCSTLRSKILARAVPYCVLLPPSYDAETERRYPVLYFLHGLGDNQEMFLHSGGIRLVEDLWDDHQIGEFLIVTPAGDKSFYINSREGRQRYEDFFLQEFMSAIEKQYRAASGRANRGIAGVSMGGYGAMHIAFQHADLFVAVGANSAALLQKLPKLGPDDLRQFTMQRVLGPAFGSPIDSAFWYKNDPLTIAKTAHLEKLQIYFDCGYEDDYGFETGAMALDKLLTERQVPHEFELFPGGHDWTYFAAHLPAVLKFQSRAFGLSPQ